MFCAVLGYSQLLMPPKKEDGLGFPFCCSTGCSRSTQAYSFAIAWTADPASRLIQTLARLLSVPLDELLSRYFISSHINFSSHLQLCIPPLVSDLALAADNSLRRTLCEYKLTLPRLIFFPYNVQSIFSMVSVSGMYLIWRTRSWFRQLVLSTLSWRPTPCHLCSRTHR